MTARHAESRKEGKGRQELQNRKAIKKGGKEREMEGEKAERGDEEREKEEEGWPELQKRKRNREGRREKEEEEER